jgi:TonB family protein
MLDPHLNRRPVSRATYVVVAAVLAVVTVSMAAAGQRLSTLSGSIADPMSGMLPGVTLVLTNEQSQAKFEVRTDPSGRYEFVGVPPGTYLFEARLPGFATFKGTVEVTGENVQRDLTLQVGSVEETVTVRSGQSGGNAPPARPASPRPKRPLRECAAPQPGGQPFVGGNIRPPRKLVHVSPVYPPDLAASGIAGQVVLRGRIGTEGAVEDLNVVSSPHQGLSAAALDAVSRWEFDETLLNCTPVAIGITARINFER